MNKTNKTDLKFDSGKLKSSLVPTIAIKALADVMTFGAEKYEEDSWKNLDNAQQRYTDALYRHLEAWRGGEKFDRESGRPHLWHVITNVAFLLWFEDDAEAKKDT